MMITISPASFSEDVLVGNVQLMVGDRHATLGADHSFQFEVTLPHLIATPSRDHAKILWIMSVVDPHL